MAVAYGTGAEQATLFRCGLMRMSRLAQDRADLTKAMKSLLRWMVGPDAANMLRLKLFVRYLL